MFIATKHEITISGTNVPYFRDFMIQSAVDLIFVDLRVLIFLKWLNNSQLVDFLLQWTLCDCPADDSQIIFGNLDGYATFPH